MKRSCIICGVALTIVVSLEFGICHECTEKYHETPHVSESQYGQTLQSRPIPATGLSATASPSPAPFMSEDEVV